MRNRKLSPFNLSTYPIESLCFDILRELKFFGETRGCNFNEVGEFLVAITYLNRQAHTHQIISPGLTRNKDNLVMPRGCVPRPREILMMHIQGTYYVIHAPIVKTLFFLFSVCWCCMLDLSQVVFGTILVCAVF